MLKLRLTPHVFWSWAEISTPTSARLGRSRTEVLLTLADSAAWTQLDVVWFPRMAPMSLMTPSSPQHLGTEPALMLLVLIIGAHAVMFRATSATTHKVGGIVNVALLLPVVNWPPTKRITRSNIAFCFAILGVCGLNTSHCSLFIEWRSSRRGRGIGIGIGHS